MNRKVEDADLEAIAQTHRHYVLHTVVTFDIEPLVVEGWRQKWRTACEGSHPWFVYEEEGRVLGFALAGEFRPWA